MIEAAYGIKDYIIEKVADAGLEVGNFYPGLYSPQSEDSNKFATYSVVPTTDYALRGLKKDTLDITLYNTNFDELQRVVHVILGILNVEDIERSDLQEDGVRYQECFVTPNSSGEASFDDGEDYYYTALEIYIIYTED